MRANGWQRVEEGKREPVKNADLWALLRMGCAMVALYCASFRQVPRCIVLDLDDTFDAVHGGQQLRLYVPAGDDRKLDEAEKLADAGDFDGADKASGDFIRRSRTAASRCSGSIRP